MTKFEIHHRFLSRLFVFLALICPALLRAAQTGLLPSGFRPVPVGVHALVGAKVVVKPGQVLDSATIIIRDGYLEKIGTDLTPPPDARVWDMKGLVIYAGFIDPYLTPGSKGTAKSPRKESELTGGGVKFFGINAQEHEAGTEGPGYEVTRATPERRV